MQDDKTFSPGWREDVQKERSGYSSENLNSTQNSWGNLVLRAFPLRVGKIPENEAALGGSNSSKWTTVDD